MGFISSLISYLILTSVQVDATTFTLGGNSRYEFELKTLSSSCDILLLKDTMEHVRTLTISIFIVVSTLVLHNSRFPKPVDITESHLQSDFET